MVTNGYGNGSNGEPFVDQLPFARSGVEGWMTEKFVTPMQNVLSDDARKQVICLGKCLGLSFVWSCFKWFFGRVGDSCGFDNFPSLGLTLRIYDISRIVLEESEEVMKGLLKCIERLVPSQNDQSKILDQLATYRNAEGIFGMSICKKQRDTKVPGDDSLTWDDVARYSGAYERDHNLRSGAVNASSSSRGRRRATTSRPHLIDEDDDIVILENSDTEEEDIEGLESDKENDEELVLDDDEEEEEEFDE